MKKKPRIKLNRIILLILILVLILCFFYVILTKPIENIYIYNNLNITDQEIIDKAKLRKYPNYFFIFKSNIEKELEKMDLVNTAEIKKKKFKEIHIFIEENRKLFYDATTKKTILSNSKEINEKNNIPILINEIEEELKIGLISKMNELTDDTLLKISEIEYKPNDIDKERFLLTMTDKNYVYLTLYKFSKINEYNNIIPSLEGKNGILYLDAGNYFEILN